MNDLINREDAIEAVRMCEQGHEIEAIRALPSAVEAIPVEWIKAFAEKNKNHIQDSVNKYTYMYDFLISEWRAENEA